MPTEEKYDNIGDMCGLAHLSIDYGNETVHVKRLWRHFTSITDGKVIGNNIVNDNIIIRNSTEYQPKLMIQKGANCQSTPLTIDIYHMDVKEINCSNHNIFTTGNIHIMLLSVLFSIGLAAAYLWN